MNLDAVNKKLAEIEEEQTAAAAEAAEADKSLWDKAKDAVSEFMEKPGEIFTTIGQVSQNQSEMELANTQAVSTTTANIAQDVYDAYQADKESWANFSERSKELQRAAAAGEITDENVDALRGAGEEFTTSLRNTALSPFRQAARSFIANNADDKDSAFQPLAQSLQQSDANLQYFMTSDEKLQKARDIEAEIGIPADAIIADDEAYKAALDVYNFKKRNDDIDAVWQEYPELQNIADMSSQAAAIALHNIQDVRTTHGIVDSFTHFLEQGNIKLEYDNLQYKIMNGEADENDKKRAENLRDMMDAEKRKAPSFFDDPAAAMAAGVAQSLPEMGQSIKEGAETALPSMVAAALFTVATGGTGALAVGGAALRAALVRAIGSQGVKQVGKYAFQVGMFRGMQKPEAGARYDELGELKDKDGNPLLTDDEKRGWAMLGGSANALIETANVGIMLNALKPYPHAARVFSDIVENAAARKSAQEKLVSLAANKSKDWLKLTVSESAEEAAQSAADDLIHNAIVEDKGERASNLKTYDAFDIAGRSAAAFLESLPGSAGFGLIGAGGGFVGGAGVIARNARREARIAQAYGENAVKTMNGTIMVEQLQQAVASGKLKEKAPDVQQKILREQLTGTGYEMAYIDIETATQKENGMADLKKVADAAGMSSEDLETAVAENGFLSVPTEVLSQVSSSPDLLDSVSFSPEAESMARMRETNKQVLQSYEEAMKETIQRKAEVIETLMKNTMPNATEEQRSMIEAAIMTSPDNPAQGWNTLRKEMQGQLDEILAPAIKALEAGMGNAGIMDVEDEQGNTKTVRYSENAPWYKNFYKQFGRKPTKAELEDMAIALVTGDPSAPQVQGWIADSQEVQEGLAENKAAISLLRDNIKALDDIKGEMQKLTGVEMELTAGLSPEAVSMYRQLYDWAKSVGGSTARQARMGAILAARHADIYARIVTEKTGRKYTAADYMREKLGFSIRPAGGGLNQLAGENAETANMKSLRKAQEMDAAGDYADDIYKETGWLKGVDGKWRFEIPDNLDAVDWSVFEKGNRENPTRLLWAIYDNPRLYEAYPWLQKIPVELSELKEGTNGGVGNYGNTQVIVINKGLADDSKSGTLIHEIQHLIQDREGLAVGGTKETAWQQIEDRIQQLSQDIKQYELGEQYAQTALDKEEIFWADEKNEEAEALVDQEMEELEKQIPEEDREKIWRLASDREYLRNELNEHFKDDYFLYRNLAGEQEARHATERAIKHTNVERARKKLEDLKAKYEAEKAKQSPEMQKMLAELETLRDKQEKTDADFDRVKEIEAAMDKDMKAAELFYTWGKGTLEMREQEAAEMPRPHGVDGHALVVFGGQEMAMASESRQEISIDGKKYRSLYGGDGVEADGKVIEDKGAYYAVKALEDEGSVEAAMAELERKSSSSLKGLASRAKAGLEFLKGKTVEFKSVVPVQAKPKAAPRISPEVIKAVEEAKKTYGPFEGEGFNPRSVVPKVRGGWTEKKILKYLKEHGTPYGVREAVNLIAEFDSVEDLKAHMFFHGSAVGSSNLKPSITMSDREIARVGGGGYGEKYWGISVTPSKKIASNFSGESRSVNIYPLILAKNAIVEEAPNLEDAADIAPHIVDYWTRGVDAVWIGDKNAGEQELLILNPRAVVNIGRSDTYDVFQLGTAKNPLRVKDDEAIARMLDVAKALKGKKEGYSYASPETREEIFFQKAWHGSPYDFETFDLGAIGSGEGAQVHGWGLYFAGDKQISENYKRVLSAGKGEVTINDKPVKISGWNFDSKQLKDAGLNEAEISAIAAISWVEASGKNYSTNQAVVDEAIKLMENATNEDDIAGLELLKSGAVVYNATKGTLFQVEIPDNDVMLDEQKAFNEQPEKVQKALKDFLNKYAKSYHYKKEGDGYVLYDGDRQVDVYDWEEDAQTSVEENNEAVQDSIDSAFRGGIESLTGREIYGGMTRLMHGDKQASEKLNDIGIKGITYEGGQDGRCFVVFDDKAIDVIEKYNQQVARQQVQGQTSLLANGKRMVSILETADESTFMHEMAHVFLYDLEELAQIDDVSAKELGIVNEWAEWHKGAAKDYKGTPWAKEFAALEDRILDAEAYGRLDEADKLKRQWKHERYARAFEIYLRDGQAPAKGLKAVFRKFKQFLRQIYAAFTSDGARASEPVKRVMDRMIASEAEIEAAELEDRYADVTKAGGEKLLNESEEETYKRWYQEAEDEAKEKVLKIVMKDLEKDKEEEFQRLVIKEETRKRKELQQENVYIAEQAVLVNGGDADIVLEWYPSVEAFQEELAATPPLEEVLADHMAVFRDNLDADLIDSKLSPEAVDKVLNMSKYRNKMEALKGKAMAKKLALISRINNKAEKAMASIEEKLTALPEDIDLKVDAADPQVKAVMAEITKLRFASKWTPADLSHIEAMIRASTQEQLRKSLKEFKEGKKQDKINEEEVMKANEGRMEALKTLAIEAMEGKPISDSCNVGYYVSQQKKAARRVRDMIKSKRWDMALQAQQQLGFHAAMVELAEKNKGLRDKYLSQVKSEVNARSVRLPKNERYWHRHLAYVLRIAQTDAKRPESGVKSLDQLFTEMENSLDILERPSNVLEMAAREENFQGYQSLTLAELKEAVDSLHVIYSVGRGKFKMKTFSGKNILDVVREVIDDYSVANQIKVDTKKINEDRGGLAYSDLVGNTGELGHLIAKHGQDYIISTLKSENIARMLGKAAHRYIYGTLERAAEDEAKLQAENIKALQEIMSAYSHKERENFKNKVYDFSTEGKQKISKEQIICMALNWGTVSNRQRLLGGLASDQRTPEAVQGMEKEVLDLFEETMTAKDWQVVQKLWDHINEYWDMTVEVEEKLNGIALQKIEASPFTMKTADGQTIKLEGGYMPVKYDPRKSSKAGEQSIDEAAQSIMAGAQRFGAGRSFTKGRSEFDIYRPLRLDFGVVESHLQDVIRNATFRLPVRDVYRIITNLDFENHVVEHMGREFHNVLKGWAVDAWKQVSDNGNTADNVLSSGLSMFRRSATMSIMGYRLWPCIENFSNISIAIGKIGAGRMLAGIADFYGSPAEAMESVKQKSIFMRNRLENMDRDIRSQPGIFRAGNKLAEFARSHAYDLMVYSDLMVSAPLWLRSYKDAMGGAIQDVKAENEKNIKYVMECQQALDAKRAEIADLIQQAYDMEAHLHDRRYASPETAPMLRQSPFAVHSDDNLRAMVGENRSKAKKLERDLWEAEVKFQEAQEIKILTDDEVLEEAERRAVFTADGVIRDTFGSGRTIDLPAIQRSRNELTKLLTTFYGFFNTQFNALYMDYVQSRHLPENKGITRWMPFAKGIMYKIMLTSLIGSTLAFGLGLKGSGEDDKKRKIKTADGKTVEEEVPAMERFLKEFGKNVISTSFGSMYLVRDIVGVASDFIFSGKTYGFSPGSVASRSASEAGKMIELLAKKGQRDADIQAQQEKREKTHQEKLRKLKGKKRQDYLKQWEEDQQYVKPPKRITYTEIAGHGLKALSGFSAANTGVTSTMVNAITGTMQYLLDEDDRYDATMKNIIWSALFDKRPVEREIPKKPEKPKETGEKKKKKQSEL